MRFECVFFVIAIYFLDLPFGNGQDAPGIQITRNKRAVGKRHDDNVIQGNAVRKDRLEEKVAKLIGKPDENGEKGSLNTLKGQMINENILESVQGKQTRGDILFDIATEWEKSQKENEEIERLATQFCEIDSSSLDANEKAFALSELYDAISDLKKTKIAEVRKIGNAANVSETSWAKKLKDLNNEIKSLEKFRRKSSHPFIGAAISKYKNFTSSFVRMQSSFEKSYEKIVAQVSVGLEGLECKILKRLNQNLANDPDGSPYLHNLLRIAIYLKSKKANSIFLSFAATETEKKEANFASALANVKNINGQTRESNNGKFDDYQGIIELLSTIIDSQTHSVETQEKLVKNIIHEIVILDGFNGISNKDKEKLNLNYVRISSLLNLARQKFDGAVKDELDKAHNNLVYIRFVGKISN